jgi:orotate phosphoribosyltransferase-like protein
VNEHQRQKRIDQARRLRGMGYTYEQVGDKLGVSGHTIHCWLDPEYAERMRQSQRNSRAKQRELGVGSTITSKPSKAYIRKPADDPPPSRLFAVDSRDKAEIMRQAIELKTRGYRAQAIAALLRVPYRAVEEALR